jgi:hypothetical protein
VGAGKRNSKIAENLYKLERSRYDESHAESRASHTAEEASISRHQSTSKNSSYGISKSTVVELEIQERKGKPAHEATTDEPILANLDTSAAERPVFWNENVTNGTVYVCGWSRRLSSYLFPEFTQVIPLELETQSDNNSLLVFGLFGPCPVIRRSIGIRWIHANWSGKTLHINGETRVKQDPRNERIFVCGTVDEASSKNYAVQNTTSMAKLLIGHLPVERRYQMFNHSLKPQSKKERFAIYATSNCVPFRQMAADSLATIGVVDQGGPCAGKAGKKRRKLPKSVSVRRENQVLFSRYRFCLVMENESYHGYVTEKILNAFLGGCIPIYFGTEQIFDIFNRKAFIYYNISEPNPALERIRYLENNRTAYDQVLGDEPILANGSLTIDQFFSFADDVGNGTMKRRIRDMLGMSP